MDKITAIVLSAGRGKRMHSDTAKQYMILHDKPILYYSLKAFQESCVDSIVLVVGQGDEVYVKKEIVERYHFTKVTSIVTGGNERYDSVYSGLLQVKDCDYVLVHDGARPMINGNMIEKIVKQVAVLKACVVGTPSKDTVKLVSTDGIVYATPNRKEVYNIQTPQAFSYELIMQAYQKLQDHSKENVTDDAMVVEQMLGVPIHIIEGSYQNIKITTPEDLMIAELFLSEES